VGGPEWQQLEESQTMSRLHEAHLSDEKLIGFALDGEALPEDAQNHPEHCAECQQRIAHYKKLHDGLVASFFS